MATARLGPAPTSRLNMAERHLISTRVDSVPIPNMMAQDIASVIYSIFFHQQALAHFRTRNVRRNAKVL